MKKIEVMPGLLIDQSETDLTKLISDFLRQIGYPILYCDTDTNRVCGTALKDLDFANDTIAAANNVPIGGLYHTLGVIKIRIV